MTLEIEGRVPSKKNSRQHIIVRGRPLNIPCKEYKEWHHTASLQIAAKRPQKPLEDAEVTITFYAPDKRRTDLTNKAESVMDLLVDCGYLADDNWDVVPHLVLKFGGVDRERPRAVVEITG